MGGINIINSVVEGAIDFVQQLAEKSTMRRKFTLHLNIKHLKIFFSNISLGQFNG